MWLPESVDAEKNDFVQSGDFYLWVEGNETPPKKTTKTHPAHLQNNELVEFVEGNFGGAAPSYIKRKTKTKINSIYLPTANNAPIPSPEFLTQDNLQKKASLRVWDVHTYHLRSPISKLKDIYFISQFHSEDIRLGQDILFWYEVSQTLKKILYKDQYIRAITMQKNADKNLAFYNCWKIISSEYEIFISKATKAMPLACSQSYELESLLRHFCEVCVHNILKRACNDLPMVFTKKIENTELSQLFLPNYDNNAINVHENNIKTFTQWLDWQETLSPTHQDSPVQLGFRLHDPKANEPDNWRLEFMRHAPDDPSVSQPLKEFWADKDHKNISKDVLVSLAHAARIYPKIWQGMDNETPCDVILTLEEATAFLQETAWILEDAGNRIILPAHLTPKGRKRAKMKMKTSASSKSSSVAAKSYLSLESLTNYSYELAIGGQSVSEQEWQKLVDNKSSLVNFRGEWMELDRDKMREMLQFWQKEKGNPQELSLQEFIKKLAEDEDDLEIDAHDALSEMLEKLNDSASFEIIKNPEKLKADLRDYQKRGVSWLRYLENIGLNGCLADDMGLGKTMQVIAALILEKEEGNNAPTLLIAPTSVIGNWQKEITKFAPHLNTFLHHGASREKKAEKLAKISITQDMVITSYNLARKDNALFKGIKWQRIVLDEAQNIKNYKTAQTKAILKLQAKYRWALTGTPVENRLMDLWSIFNFLNPGYLGTPAQFRKNYEVPIQRDNDIVQSKVLKKLIQPFMLRRVKTDKNIIKDLPDKIEAKQYCNLSKEQAALYEAVVNDVGDKLEESEGIGRQGLMLSTLMKLKQICNHPAQFLQDDSAFTAERSHKLKRMGDMLEEATLAGDSVLIFTQFTEIGEKIVKYVSQEKLANCYYIHGGVSRKKRDQMIEEFQNPDNPPAVFVLSLKAGGVGITLTRANRVFHFDRWWNPAVENQATDRAFRIGQKKNVFVYKFITLGTLEERIDQMIEDKQKMADSIVGSDESWLTKLDNNAFKELISLNKDKIVEG